MKAARSAVLLITLWQGVSAVAQPADRSAPFHIDLTGLDLSVSPPVRDPANPAYPRASALADGRLPGKAENGNFIIGPTHEAAPETAERPGGLAESRVERFTFTSAESRIYRPGIVREEASRNAAVNSAATAPGDPSNLMVTSSHAGHWTREIIVYIPAGAHPGPALPFMVLGDGEGKNAGLIIRVLDRLIAAKRVPRMAAILIGSGGQDAQGSERGREYDTVSGTYAEWVEAEVIPAVERRYRLKLSHDPDRRATMGFSSSGAAAFTMAWFRPDLYHRVLAYSPTFVNQQWPHDPALPGGAWQYHSPWAGAAPPSLMARGFGPLEPSAAALPGPLVAEAPRKPIRFWFAVGDRDLFYPNPAMQDGMHDWVLASERMAAALSAKDYAYQFLFVRNASHVDPAMVAQTLPAALEWLWAEPPAP